MSLRDYLLKQEREYVVGRIAHGPDPEKQQELREKIASGEIDAGPIPDHSKPVEDKRPPEIYGELLWLKILAERNGHRADATRTSLPELRDLH